MRKRTLSFLLALAMCLAMLPSAAMAASGTCGDNLTWSLDDAGTLTISGIGPMTDYGVSNKAPWYSAKDSILKIIIESGVTDIGEWTFTECINLTDVTIPNSVIDIGDTAFASCEHLTDLTIPNSVTRIGVQAFQKCTNLTNVTIPDTVTSIGNAAFLRCTSLTNVTIPNSVTNIGYDVFYGCTKLNNITIPDSVTSIGIQAFRECTGLISINIPNKVTSIGDNLFTDCTSLNSITIPDSVASIGSSVFRGCTSLADVYYWGTKATWDSIAVGTNNDLLTNATRWYAGPATITTSTPETGATDPVVTITSDRPFAPIRAAARSMSMNNVTVDEGTTGLTLSSVSLDPSDTANKTMLLGFTGSSKGGSISVTIDSAAFAGPENFTTADATTITMSAVPVDPAPVDPDPIYPMYPDPAPKPSPKPVPDLGKASIQEEAVRKDKTYRDWIDRLELPEYAEKLYGTISGARDKSRPGIFENERNFALPKASAAPQVSDVTRIEVTEFDLFDTYTAPGAELGKEIFAQESFYSIAPNAEDRKIDCAKLAAGDLVLSPNFNGVYVTKIPYDDGFDSKKQEVAEYVAAVYHAFDRDNPEIFWLSGKCRARVMVASDPATKEKAGYFFLVLADKDGFDMRAPAWTGAGTIASGIAKRDAAVSGILETITATDAAGRAKQLNKWLTEHNQYNTTQDLTTIGNEPHECLSALEGRIGTDGPVCDGYSRAFKVLCDKLGVPCVLETGWAKSKANGAPGFHMWNLAQVGGTWYGCDITWDDPLVRGPAAALSGLENEDYLLVGSGTTRNGMTFAQSHVVENQAAVGGVDFNNGPSMGLTAYSGLEAGPDFTASDPIPAAGTAVASTQEILLDGKQLELQCYAIREDGGLANYVRLRDLLYALEGAGARFGVKWDGSSQRVVVVSDTAYTPDGSENAAPFTGDRAYKVDSNPVSFDGTDALLAAFRLFDDQGGGYTYYKLRDLGRLLDFNVGWDSTKGIFVETGKPYDPNN